MEVNETNNRGQFSIIAALLVAVILVATLIAVYATVRYSSSQNQTPQTLTATDETNSAITKALGFTVGYYGSILQVTGNQTYAYANATIYMKSALQYISNMNPSLGESINLTSLSLRTNWFSNPSESTGTVSVVYDLANLGIYGASYTTSCSLGVQIFGSPNSNQVRVNVTQDLAEPLTGLGQENFAFYSYDYLNSNWQLVSPISTPTIFANGTYLINLPSGVDASAYMLQVTDSRGIMTAASSFNSYNLDFVFSAHSSSSPAVVELLQNGTMRWFGQGLLNSTQLRPIPPVSLKSLHLCQAGSTTDIPFQVEDWASNYQIPLALSNNYTIFSNSQMIVFEVAPSMSQLTLWWNGSDTAIQPSAAYTNIYFAGDNPAGGTLSNGLMTLQFSYPGSSFQIRSTVGGVSSTANFMRIDAEHSTYGSGAPAYVVHHGVVRDIVQEEAEWTNGPTNCPNVYSQIVFTLPANATYFTYQLRLIAINSAAARNVDDISPIQLTTSISQPQAMTENGISNGIPIVANGTGTFNNSTGNAHHWSQLINSGLQGTGIMFTDSANQLLYAFDSMAGEFTGALYASTSVPVIELDPVTSAGSVSFTSPLDLTWYGAVATFNGANPICANNGNSGLWPIVEQPPSVNIVPVSSGAPWIDVSPPADPVGTSVTVYGGGFIPNSPITITYNGNTVATTTSNNYGMIQSGTTFVIPSSSPGSYTISAIDTSSNSASVNFTVTLHSVFPITFQTNGTTSGVGSDTIFTIDSVQYQHSALPISFNWEEGTTHTIDASSIIRHSANIQYSWLSWSDGGAQTHNYTVPPSSATLIANYVTQYQVTFNYQVSGGGSPTAPSVTYYQSGSQLSITAGPSATVWVDSGSTYTYQNNPLTGSGASERWYASSSTSGTISSSLTINPTYYHQYLMTLSYSVSGGGSPTAPTLTSTQFGGAYTPTLTGSATGYWLDNGASWSVTNPLGGSSGTQRWRTSQTVSGTVSSSATMAFSYYRQYLMTLSYSLSGGGSPSAPTLTSTQFGGAYTPTLTGSATGYWLDNGASWSVTNPLGGSSGTERWYTGQSVSGTVSATTTIAFVYNHQYQVTFDASSNVKGDSSTTIVTVAGNSYNYAQLPYTNWFNAGSLTYSYSSPIGSSSSSTTGYYWSSTSGLGQTLQSNTFTVSGTGTVTAAYTTRLFGIDANCIGYGSLPSSGSSPIVTTSMTAQANELIMIVITQGNSGSSNIRTFSLTDSFGVDLTYTQKGSTVSSGSNAEAISVYYAVTDSSHTGSFTITVTPSSYSRNFDVLVFGITGANTASPFDSNAALPRTNSNTGTSTPTVTGISTSNANDMILAFEGQLSSTVQTASSPFQSIASLLRNSNGEGCNVQYEIVTQTQTNISAQFGQSVSNWVMIVNAVKRAW